MPRFVLLYHECPAHQERPSHWDLMFEVDGVLRTWALDRLPGAWSEVQRATHARCAVCSALAVSDEVEVRQLPDHRCDYLEYEGPLDDDRGMVFRVDQGTYSTVIESPAEWQVSVAGQLLHGQIVLRPGATVSQWQLCYRSA